MTKAVQEAVQQEAVQQEAMQQEAMQEAVQEAVQEAPLEAVQEAPLEALCCCQSSTAAEPLGALHRQEAASTQESKIGLWAETWK
jgi:hypothetical protein